MLNVHSIETFGTQDGPGIRLVLFLQGCNFHCVYCHNPDTQLMKNDQAKKMTDEDLLEMLEDQRVYFNSEGGLTVSGGEPTLQAKDLITFFKKAKQRGFNLALDTAGTIFDDRIKELYQLTDLVILDVKHINEKWHQKITGASLRTVLQCAEYREKTGQKMWLRYVLVPGWTDQEEYLHQWAKTFQSYQTVEKVELIAYHTLGVYKYKELGWPYQLAGVKAPTEKECQRAKKIFDRYLKNVVIK